MECHTSNCPPRGLVTHAQVGSPVSAIKHRVQICTTRSEAKVVVGFEDNPIWQGEVGVAMHRAGGGGDVHEHDARHRDDSRVTLARVAVVPVLGGLPLQTVRGIQLEARLQEADNFESMK